MDYKMDYDKFYDTMKKGTTTIGLVCSDGVVMAADLRVTADTFIASTEGIKVYKISENVGMTVAGAVGDVEYLYKVLRVQNELFAMNEGHAMSPTSATSLLSIILQENKVYPFWVQLVIGGLNSKNQPEIFSIDALGGSTKESKFTSTGSGSLTALGYIEGAYSSNMSTQEGVKCALEALKIAMKRDSASGDGTRVVTITKKGYKEYTKEETEKLMK